MSAANEQPPQKLDLFEAAVSDLLQAFDVERPPVPIELMLKRPKPGMWQEVNLSELSLSFISVKHLYSPRMSVARLLARHICRSEWGAQRQLSVFATSDEDIRMLARAIIIPSSMLAEVSFSSRTAISLSNRFEVPEEDANQRLIDLGLVQGDKN